MVEGSKVVSSAVLEAGDNGLSAGICWSCDSTSEEDSEGIMEAGISLLEVWFLDKLEYRVHRSKTGHIRWMGSCLKEILKG